MYVWRKHNIIYLKYFFLHFSSVNSPVRFVLRDVLLPLLVELPLLLGLVRPGLSLVPHVRLVAQLRVRPVGDDLDAAVRQLHSLNRISLRFSGSPPAFEDNYLYSPDKN